MIDHLRERAIEANEKPILTPDIEPLSTLFQGILK